MIDKYKYTTLSYSKTGLSCRPFHKEGFYREKSPVHTSFSQFLLSNEAKNASRMPLGCLSDASKMPSWRDLQAAEQPIYGRRNLSCRRQHVGLQGLKGSVFAILSRGNHQESARDPIEKLVKNSLQIRHVQFVLASLQHYIITLLRFHFHFSFSAFRPFAVIKTTPPKNEARSDAEEDYRSSSAPRKWLEKFFQRAKSDLCGKQKASMLSLFG